MLAGRILSTHLAATLRSFKFCISTLADARLLIPQPFYNQCVSSREKSVHSKQLITLLESALTRLSRLNSFIFRTYKKTGGGGRAFPHLLLHLITPRLWDRPTRKIGDCKRNVRPFILQKKFAYAVDFLPARRL